MSIPGRGASGAFSPARTPTGVLLLLLACGVALSPLSPKIAGAVWLLFSGWGIFLALRRRPQAVVAAGLPAARCWLLACAVATVLGGAALWYWSDPFDGMNAELRLLIAAAATWGVLVRGPTLPRFSTGAAHAVAASCVVALMCIGADMALYANPRDHLPANAIVWALGVAFALAVLLPLVLDEETATTSTRRWWIVAAALGMVAVLLSQSRGAMGIFAWIPCLVVGYWRRYHGHWPAGRIGALLLAVAAVAGGLWAMPGDPLRLRQAEYEVVRAEGGAGFDTSMGTRVYLWHLARDGIRSSPWIGIGGTERLRRIKHAGDELPEAQRASLWYVRLMGHVHNQYLHSALDGGLVGLGAILAFMAGMAGAAWRLRRSDPLASRQMQGLLFVHATAALTNVNFAHNYYVLVLGAGVTLVLLGAVQRSGNTDAVVPPPP